MSPVVTATRVTKRFGSITAVGDLSITVGDGEIVALLGPNGAGKTTVIRVLRRHADVWEGTELARDQAVGAGELRR